MTELEKALEISRAAEDPADELETQLRIAQCQLLRGDLDAALGLMSLRSRTVDGSRHPTLRRRCTESGARTGNRPPRGSRDALERSLASLRSAKPDQSIKSAEYELGLTYDALERLAQGQRPSRTETTRDSAT